MKRPRVLLADDHVLIAQALEHLLQAEFDVVGTVSDGRALLKAAGELLPDVVVVDIGMPLLNGLDAGEQLKALHPGIKIVFLTQNREPRFAVEAFRRQASGYLLKDCGRIRADDGDSGRARTARPTSHRRLPAAWATSRRARRRVRSRFAT